MAREPRALRREDRDHALAVHNGSFLYSRTLVDGAYSTPFSVEGTRAQGGQGLESPAGEKETSTPGQRATL